MFTGELQQPVTILKGLGPHTAGALSRLNINAIGDMLLNFPREWENRRDSVPLGAWSGAPFSANTVIEVLAHEYFGWGRNRTLKVIVRDESAEGALLCFGRPFLKDKLKPGERFYLYGQFTRKYGELQCSAFEVERYSEKPKLFGRILPIYRLTEGLSQKILRKSVWAALLEFGRFADETLPERLRAQYEYPGAAEALFQIHFPDSEESLLRAQNRLKYEELFYMQAMFARHNQARELKTSRTRAFRGELARNLIAALPFTLTADQNAVLEEIRTDLASSRCMARLLQGDVGCGKTLVAFLSALYCIEAGEQAALMAPTELLAKQHAENAARYLEPLGVRLAFLSGRSENRHRLLKALAEGDVDFVIGTHALFSEGVNFRNLGYVIVDEQHRFGVEQRMHLVEKGDRVDLLLMSATPIPRTLTLTAFGDLDISTIRTMPGGRLPVKTHLARHGNEQKVFDWVGRELAKGNQAYFVYPLIEESGKLNLKDAESAYERLKNEVFPDVSSALLHSRVDEAEKERVMREFQSGEIAVLVATSVVEVGVDVPDATCMVIEHAERFGLAALHQLRGRVGRGSKQAFTFLVFSEELTETGKQRLKIMKENHDGFTIAEEDLKLRGAGELTGSRQSGYIPFRIAALPRDLELLERARADIIEILKADPGLLEDEHQIVRRFLAFRFPEAENRLQGG